MSIGDKGRSQLMRSEGRLFTNVFAETYKVRVTFAQVSARLGRAVPFGSCFPFSCGVYRTGMRVFHGCLRVT